MTDKTKALKNQRGNGYSAFDVALPPPANETGEDGAFAWELIVEASNAFTDR